MLSVPDKDSVQVFSMLMCSHPTCRCTDRSVSGGLPTSSLIEIVGCYSPQNSVNLQFIYWLPNIFIFYYLFPASYDAAIDNIQFVVIKVFNVLFILVLFLKSRGHAVAQLVGALRYKPQGHEFCSRWCHWNFSLT